MIGREDLNDLENDVIWKTYTDAYYGDFDVEKLKIIDSIRQTKLREEELAAEKKKEEDMKWLEIAKFGAGLLLGAANLALSAYTIHAVTKKEKVYEEPFLTQGDRAIVNNAMRNAMNNGPKF